jgi:hypothetical protein
MILCNECGHINPEVITKVEDFETYELCARCKSEDSLIYMDDLEYEEQLLEASRERENYEI